MIADNEIVKAQTIVAIDLLDYQFNTIVTKTVLKKASGNVSVMAFDHGQGWAEKSSPFDHFVQIIDGNIELNIAGSVYFLQTGQSIVVPAHAMNSIKPNGRFKLILTLIKSGYE